MGLFLLFSIFYFIGRNILSKSYGEGLWPSQKTLFRTCDYILDFKKPLSLQKAVLGHDILDNRDLLQHNDNAE